MASFEPIVVVYGSSSSVATTKLRFPVSVSFVFDASSLEQLINTNPPLTDTCLQRYFVILLDALAKDLLAQLKTSHRVVAVYQQDRIRLDSSGQSNQMTAVSRQLSLDLTNDIVRFLTAEGEKQIKLERIPLATVYYQQARTLKQWVMSLAKAEPCHILLIPLNSSQENLDDAQQRLHKVCSKLGYSSVVIRQLNDYIPNDDNHLSLMPYAKLLFTNESPQYACRLIKSLSPIRFYLYGNQLSIPSEWSKLMIATEKDVMDDEDNWCAFLENELIDSEVKWNLPFMFGRGWKVSRVAPLDFSRLDDEPRFHSALRRAFVTFADRQIEVTAEVFNWEDDCIANGHLRQEPRLTQEQKAGKANRWGRFVFQPQEKYRFIGLSACDYGRLDSFNISSISFVWFDEMLHESNSEFDRMIEPAQWVFFDRISSCLAFIEAQLRERRCVFLVVSGALGKELFLSDVCLIRQVFAAYIYCAQLNPHLEWTSLYLQIRGVFNDSRKLASRIGKDLHELRASLATYDINDASNSHVTSEDKKLRKAFCAEWPSPLPIMVYDQEQSHLFLAHQRTIDSILCMPHTPESQAEMLAEFRRLYADNPAILAEIDRFECTYTSNAAVEWYTRDSFIPKTINQALRDSNADAMFKLRYILTDIYAHLSEMHRQGSYHTIRHEQTVETFYRGQVMSPKEFDSFKDLRGSTISINAFLSGTASMQIALMYASKFDGNPDLISVVFSIEIEPRLTVRPFANISRHSVFPDEDEVLFAMGSVFRVGNIRELRDSENIWIIHLRTVSLNE